MAAKSIRQVACDISSELFTNGAGKHAMALNIELPGHHYGGGWSEYAVSAVIEKHLLAQQSIHADAAPTDAAGDNQNG